MKAKGQAVLHSICIYGSFNLNVSQLIRCKNDFATITNIFEHNGFSFEFVHILQLKNKPFKFSHIVFTIAETAK